MSVWSSVSLTFKPRPGPSLGELPLTKFTSAWQGLMSQHGESPLETSQQKVGVYQIEFNVDVGRTGFYCSVITSRHYIERNYPATTHLKLLPFYSYTDIGKSSFWNQVFRCQGPKVPLLLVYFCNLYYIAHGFKLIYIWHGSLPLQCIGRGIRFYVFEELERQNLLKQTVCSTNLKVYISPRSDI